MNVVFMDESGNKESDRFFVCGFLEVENNQEFVSKLQRVRDQIFDASYRSRQNRAEYLFEQKDLSQLYKLASNFSGFELKHYLITHENQKLYCDLIKVLIRKTKFNFMAVVIDRLNLSYRRPDNKNDIYFKCVNYFCDNFTNTSYIFVPDSFDHNFIWSVNSKNKPGLILPLNSKSCIQLQVVDILTGLVAQSLRGNFKNLQTNKDKVRNSVLNTLEQEIGVDLTFNLDIQIPQSFRIYKLI